MYNYVGDKMIIGSHVSFDAKQLLTSAKQAVSYGANTFMFYTGAPQNTIRKDIDENFNGVCRMIDRVINERIETLP